MTCFQCGDIVPLVTRDADELNFAMVDIQKSLRELYDYMAGLPEGVASDADHARGCRYRLKAIARDVDMVRDRFQLMTQDFRWHDEVPFD